MKINDYIIANRRVRLCSRIADVVEEYLHSFDGFKLPTSAHDKVLIELSDGEVCSDAVAQLLTSFDFDEGQATCRFYRCDSSYMLRIEGAECSVVVVCDEGVKCASVNIPAAVTPQYVSYLRFAVWFVVGMAMVLDGVSAVHASTIVCHDKAVMFLGESGTGKSTHTRLWLDNIEGAELLNDDSPFVFEDVGCVCACGSPWSGKTPCYKNKYYPLAAVVRLSQAPHNKIYKLSKLQAIGAMLPSMPPAFVYDKSLEEALLAVLSKVLSHVPVYHLECLPDADAAFLSYKTVMGV